MPLPSQYTNFIQAVVATMIKLYEELASKIMYSIHMQNKIQGEGLQAKT